MSTIDDGGPAFPVVGYKQSGGMGVSVMEITGGMSLRDYFAAKAMQGLFAAGGGVTRGAEEWASLAYTMADAMLAARKEKP